MNPRPPAKITAFRKRACAFDVMPFADFTSQATKTAILRPTISGVIVIGCQPIKSEDPL